MADSDFGQRELLLQRRRALRMSLRNTESGFELLSPDRASIWLRHSVSKPKEHVSLTDSDTREAAQRFEKFATVLAALFKQDDWDGRVKSKLLEYPGTTQAPGKLFVKADHELPMTGSIKARGGVYELLCRIEALALEAGLIDENHSYDALLKPSARDLFSAHRVVVASTGNLGFSVGLVARAFGMNAEIHMSSDAKRWKKDRLRNIGADVIEYDSDYEQAVGRARRACEQQGGYFIDDERSVDLFVGYTTAARELAVQLRDRGLEISPRRPLVVYLPCGVGGAPGGVAWGLRNIYGPNVVPVFVEPIASACVYVALAKGDGESVSVYDYGLNNDTIADGLAVPKAPRDRERDLRPL
ncbi:MAG: D-serine ammonia-lyase, partial [Pseudomonadota bacterium]